MIFSHCNLLKYFKVINIVVSRWKCLVQFPKGKFIQYDKGGGGGENIDGGSEDF